MDQGVLISIRYSDIDDIDLGNYSDTEVLGVISSKGVLEIEKIWMKKKEYNELHKILNEKVKGIRT
ncbi:hypothetical protein [Winogradskyella sp. 3972H.M.0a.05]|uniref:hypothetical protein n=1 Tax=Winogradskyella sp. 3972H.M.0a.05 TaxID=2950277 RepID=UPI003397A7B6